MSHHGPTQEEEVCLNNLMFEMAHSTLESVTVEKLAV